MPSIDTLLRQRFSVAMALAFGAENAVDPLIKTGDPKFADYQSNVAMSLSKRVSLPPRAVAEAILKDLSIDDICDPPTIAGPGFINLRLKKSFLTDTLNAAFADNERAGVDKVEEPLTILIDYSGPNVAKQMHVGHLRSTILGDTLSRTFTFLGHTVVPQNHIGDFGTQFGMLIHHIRENKLQESPMDIEALDRLYKEASDRFKADPAFAEVARKTVVELQSGQPDAVAIWNRMRVTTRTHYTEVYKLLGIQLTDNDERGESFFGTRLPQIIERVKGTLENGGEGALVSAHSGTSLDTTDEPLGHEPTGPTDLPGTQDAKHRVEESKEPEVIHKPFASYSDGAFCVFLPGYVTKEKEPLPFMLQKKDGGYPYSATDLAALFFRVQEHKETPQDQKPLGKDWHADRVIVCTDDRQALHFAMLYDTFRAAQWDHNPHTKRTVSLEHAPFGSILGDDGKPFKTRSGDTVKLQELLDEAIERAAAVKAERGSELDEATRAKIAKAVGIGAVKYADLKQDRTTNYIFSWDRMLSFEGNTGPYLQYQYTRIQSIYRKASTTREAIRAAAPTLILDHDMEAALAKKLLQLTPVIEAVARDLKPHHLCTYLYELATTFSQFFENCPVLKAENDALKNSRLLLCDRTATTLKIGLQNLLGIQVLDEM